ncbi:MAG: hypothetical protein M9900_06640 [Flavobacteriales bacterium]|nr:hypothetical protein [Flavobacteriales bacterium]
MRDRRLQASSNHRIMPMVFRIVMSLLVFVALVDVGYAQDDDLLSQYFNMLFQQYKDQTGDSIQGYIGSSDAETLANTMFDSGKYGEAIIYFDKLVRKHPTGWNYFRRGYCHYMVKHYPEAVEDFTRSIARFPDPLLSSWWVGSSVYQDPESKRYTKGASISMQYQYNDAYFFRGESKVLLDDYYGCIADMESYFANIDSTAKRFPHIENTAYRLSGYSKMKIDDLRGAVQDFRAAIEIDDQDKSSYYYLGITLISLSQIPEGCRSLSRAGELGVTEAYQVIREHCGSVR